MTSLPSILKRAKQGDANAIASLITHHLQPQGIIVRAKLTGDCLRLMLESAQVPSQRAVVPYIYQGMKRLNIASIKTIKLYAKQIDKNYPDWSQVLDLTSSVSLDMRQVNAKQDLLVSSVKEHNYKLTDKSSPIVITNRISSILIGSIWMLVSLNSLSLFYVICATSSYIYYLLSIIEPTGLLVDLVGILIKLVHYLATPLEYITRWSYAITFVIILVWVYYLHISLRYIFGKYSITPWGAIARFSIPIYSLWGIWNTFSTLAKRSRALGSQLERAGKSLQLWLPWFYIAWILVTIFTQVYQSYFRANNEANLPFWLLVINSTVSLMFVVVVLIIVKIVNNIINLTKTNVFHQNSSVALRNLVNSSDIKKQKIVFKAVFYGVLLEIMVTYAGNFFFFSFINLFLGFTEVVNQSPSNDSVFFASMSFTIGLISVLAGGFLAAHCAGHSEVTHSLLTGICIVFVAIFVILILGGIDSLVTYFNMFILTLTIPVALLGGYLRVISKRSTSLLNPPS